MRSSGKDGEGVLLVLFISSFWGGSEDGQFGLVVVDVDELVDLGAEFGKVSKDEGVGRVDEGVDMVEFLTDALELAFESGDAGMLLFENSGKFVVS